MTRNNSLLLIALASSLASSAWASNQQTSPNVRRGMASSLAAGLSLHGTSSAEDLVRVKAPLDQTTPPPAYISASYSQPPNYELSSMFPSYYGVIEIDAHSTGNDVIPHLTPDGAPNLTNPGRWMAVTVSVTNGTVGAADSLIERRRGLTGPVRTSPGADLISYYFKESVGIDQSLLGRTLIEQQAEDISYTDDEDLDALDWGIGVITHAQGVPAPLFFPETDFFYFSVSNDCIDDLNVGYPAIPFAVDDQSQPVLADGASVYVITKVGMGWSGPVLYRAASQLGLAPKITGVQEGDELDALAVDAGTTVTVFSTQPRTGYSQLRAHDLNLYPGQVFDLENQAGNLIASNLGLKSNDETENIDAVCIIEPEPGDLGTHLGTPTGRDFYETNPMGISMTRWISPQGQDEILVHATGWGGMPEYGGAVGFMIAPDYYPTPFASNANWIGLQIVPRNDGQSSVAHPPISVPAGMALDLALIALYTHDGSVIKVSQVAQFDIL